MPYGQSICRIVIVPCLESVCSLRKAIFTSVGDFFAIDNSVLDSPKGQAQLLILYSSRDKNAVSVVRLIFPPVDAEIVRDPDRKFKAAILDRNGSFIRCAGPFHDTDSKNCHQ